MSRAVLTLHGVPAVQAPQRGRHALQPVCGCRVHLAITPAVDPVAHGREPEAEIGGRRAARPSARLSKTGRRGARPKCGRLPRSRTALSVSSR